MEIKSRSFTFKEPQVAREQQVADPWSRQFEGQGSFRGSYQTFVLEI